MSSKKDSELVNSGRSMNPPTSETELQNLSDSQYLYRYLLSDQPIEEASIQSLTAPHIQHHLRNSCL